MPAKGCRKRSCWRSRTSTARTATPCTTPIRPRSSTAARARSSTTRRGAPTSTCRCGIRPSTSAIATERLNEAARRQLDRLPQVASQYLHREKIELAAMLAKDGRAEVRAEGPRPLQCRRQPGGRGQPEARAQRQERQEPDVRLRGRLSRPHARRLRDHLVLPLSPALRPLRRPRAVRAVPLPLPRPQGHDARRNTATTASSTSSACSRANTTASGIPRPARPSSPPSTSSRSRAPAATSSRPRTSSPSSSACSTSTASCWSSTRSRWASTAPASCGRSSISASSRTSSCSARPSPTASTRWPASGRARS